MADPDVLHALRVEEEKLANRLAAVRNAITGLEEAETSARDGIRASDFRGMKIVEAVAKYFDLTKKKSAHLYDDVMPALLRGGADLGEKPERHPRNLKIAVRMNSKPHHRLAYDENTDVVSLRSQKGQKTA